jgi:hypothetical protein
MKRARWVALGVLLAIAGGALAVQTTGVPAILRLVGLGVNTTAAAGTIAVQAKAGNFALNANGVANTPVAQFLAAPSPTGQSKGVWVYGGTNSSDFALDVFNVAGSSDFFKIDGAGNITTPNAASAPWPLIGDAATGVPRILYARWNMTAGGCTKTNGSSGWNASGGPGSGSCTLPFTHAFSGAPTCTASSENGTATVFAGVTGGVATSQVSVSLETTGGAGSTGNFDVICVGT